MINKRIKSILLFIFLLLGSSYFPYIPAYILKLDITALSANTRILYVFFCDLAFIIIVYLLYRKEINKNFKAYFTNFDDNFRFSLKHYIIGYIIMVISNLIIGFFFENATAGNEEMVRSLIDNYPLYMFFSVTIYAPFIEEITFRKAIYDIVYSYKETKYTKYIYITTSGVVFSAMHVLGTASTTSDYLYIIPYLSLGIAFAILYQKTKNIFSTVTMHAFHNFIAIIAYLGGL